MSGRLEPVHLGPGEGAAMRNPVGGATVAKVGGDQSGGRVAVLESELAPGEGPPLHIHAGEDEAWYALAGELRFRLGDEVHPAPVGSFVFVPRGLPHCFQNVGDGPARALVIFTPAGMERFFERFGALTQEQAGLEAFRAIGADVGMQVVGQPLAQSHPAEARRPQAGHRRAPPHGLERTPPTTGGAGS